MPANREKHAYPAAAGDRDRQRGDVDGLRDAVRFSWWQGVGVAAPYVTVSGLTVENASVGATLADGIVTAGLVHLFTGDG